MVLSQGEEEGYDYEGEHEASFFSEKVPFLKFSKDNVDVSL